MSATCRAGLPFTALKLDKALVRASAQEPAAQAVLEHTAADGRAAGMLVIAEGVADDATWRRMQALGVDAAQGYHVGRPMTARAAAIWHAEWMRESP